MFLIGKSFWKPLDKYFYEKMERQMKTIAKGDRSIYRITDNVEEVVEAANKIGHPSIYDNLYNTNGNKKYKGI